MKRWIVVLVTLSLALTSITALAEGDKQRGDNATGPANQHQTVPPWWVE